jgi:hypothetical protein
VRSQRTDSQVDAEVVLCALVSRIREVVGGARVAIDWSAEMVAQDRGELSLHTRLVCKHGECAVKGPVGDVVALGPVLPGREGADEEPPLAD